MITIVRGEDNKIYNMPVALKPFLHSELILSNPAYEELIKYGRWVGKTPRRLTLMKEYQDYISIPRGFFENFVEMLDSVAERYEIIDERKDFPALEVGIEVTLRTTQQPAVKDMLKSTNGILIAPPGAGKTVAALYVAAKLGQPTLWITHTTRLFDQVIDRAISFLDVDFESIGRIVGSNIQLKPFLNIAMIQSMHRKQLAQFGNKFGLVILDECHHCPASIFMNIVNYFNAKYVYGLTATAYRRDRMEPFLFQAIGKKLATISREELIRAGEITVPILKQVYTDIPFDYSDVYSRLIGSIVHNEKRNTLIASLILQEVVDKENFIMGLSTREGHAQLIYETLKSCGAPVEIATGKTSTKKNKEAVDNFVEGRARILISTYQYIGEGYDNSKINRLFLMTPIGIKGKALLVQAFGRAQRSFGSKQSVVYDFIDDCTLLEVQARARVNNLKEEWGSALKIEKGGRN